jgi:hypothetical protein
LPSASETDRVAVVEARDRALGMEGFVVGAQLEVDGELLLVVEMAVGLVGCDGCGTRAVGHGRREGQGARSAHR